MCHSKGDGRVGVVCSGRGGGEVHAERCEGFQHFPHYRGAFYAKHQRSALPTRIASCIQQIKEIQNNGCAPGHKLLSYSAPALHKNENLQTRM